MVLFIYITKVNIKKTRISMKKIITSSIDFQGCSLSVKSINNNSEIEHKNSNNKHECKNINNNNKIKYKNSNNTIVIIRLSITYPTLFKTTLHVCLLATKHTFVPLATRV